MQTTSSQLINLARFRILVFTLLIACLQFYTGHAGATSINIGLGASPNITSDYEASFTDITGTGLQGQTLSLDFLFLNGKFVRLFNATSNTFDILITLQTSGAGQVGFLDGTGYLFDQQGNPLDAPQVLGSASGNNGSMAAGLFPLLGGGLQRPLDFFGVHFDLILPNDPSVTITSSDFGLLSDPGAPFGIGPGVPRDITTPDTGSSFLLVCLGSLGLMLVRMRLTRAT
jgi:hypothetical protein